MSSRTIKIIIGCFAALAMFAGCSSFRDVASSSVKEKVPVEVGHVQYDDRVIPVFDGWTVKCDKSTPPEYPLELRRSGIEGEGIVMIIVDEKGKAVDIRIVSSTPDPQFGFAAVSAAKQWRYFPMKDLAGVPFVHALRMPVFFRLARD